MVLLLASSVKLEDSLRLREAVSEQLFGFVSNRHRTSQCVLRKEPSEEESLPRSKSIGYNGGRISKQSYSGIARRV